MDHLFFRVLAAFFLLACGWTPGAAHAGEALYATCRAGTAYERGIDHPPVPPEAAWTCGPTDFVGSPEVSWIFFTPDDFAAGKVVPSHFVTDIGAFSRLTLIPMGPDGPVRSRSYTPDEISAFVNGPKFALPLPDMRGASGLVVAIEKPWIPALTSQATLETRHGETDALGWTDDAMLAIAILLGMMIAPLAYHAAFFRILRHKFVLWQMATQISLIGFVVVSSGLVHHVIAIGLYPTITLLALTIVASGCAATGFFVTYIEPEKLSAAMRHRLMQATITTCFLGLFAALPLPVLRPMSHAILMIAPIPLILAIGIACICALRAGSRAVRVQIGAWTALSLTGALLAMRSAGLPIGTGFLGEMMYLAIAAHTAFASYAVVQRVDSMRRERERVNARLDALTNLIDLDPLTGIFNRRALEKRFAELRSDGFHALAVIDLDHFKRVNDQYGHTMGDRVLQEVAAVLAGDADSIAFRMGGEEFVVMLRGAHVQQRADQLRRAITIRIANEIEGIDNPITASMGLIESPPGGASTMRQLYSNADRLLYEAKNSGRNRLISERIRIFEPPRRDRRTQDRRQAEA